MTENEKYERIYGDYFNSIQNIINRMAQNSFYIKAWTITIIAGILVLTFSILNIIIFGTLLVISLFFWVLDSYYLKLERIFRRLYNQKVQDYNNEQKRKNMLLFDMNIKPFEDLEKKVIRIMISKSELLFYIPIILIITILLIYSIIAIL